MERYHGVKHEAGIPIKILMAHPPTDENGDATGPAISFRGRPAIALIRITNLKQRIAYGVAAELLLDADKWQESGDEELIAILDHELMHLELVTKGGNVVRDDADMPKLRKREHDQECGWFDAVAHRHGEHSIEVQQCRAFIESDDYKQCYLPGMEPVGV
jgi:hypothetical protein